jgi:sugar phosphate isomerase/epimerase
MNIALASYSFHIHKKLGKIDVFGYLETVKYRYGLNAADIWNGMLESLDEPYLRKVKEGLEERELVLANLCVDRAHLWDLDPEVREELHRKGWEHLKAAAYLGARTMRVDIGGDRQRTTTAISDEHFELLVERYREYAQFAYDNGMKVGPENHYGAGLVPDNIIRLSEAVDHPGYGILLHSGRWSENQEQGDKLCAKWAMHTHFDARVSSTTVREAVRTLMDAGYEGYYSVEYGDKVNEYSESAFCLAGLRRAVIAEAGGVEA